jgi:hypothetical protein
MVHPPSLLNGRFRYNDSATEDRAHHGRTRQMITRCLILFATLLVNAQTVSEVRCDFGTLGVVVQVSFSSGAELGPAVSPDGRMLAFEYFHPEKPEIPQIWVMNRDEGFRSARPVVDNGKYNSWPSWSVDGHWISFMSYLASVGTPPTAQIYKINVDDGTLIQLTHFPKGTSLGDSTSWSRDGRIAFAFDDDIYVVGESGTPPTKLVGLKSILSPGTLWGIEWSPDSSMLVFRGVPASSKGEVIWIAGSDGRKIHRITGGHVFKGIIDQTPSWLDNNHILFERWFLATGEVRVCMVCVKRSTVHCLTRNHFDVSPRADPGAREIFFARGEIPKTDLNGFFPVTHIFARRVRRR